MSIIPMMVIAIEAITLVEAEIPRPEIGDGALGARAQLGGQTGERPMVSRRSFMISIAGIAALSAGTAGVGAQQGTFPSKTIKMIIPNPPGGPGDVVARAYAERAQRLLEQSIVFDYRAGASTTIGTQAVVNSEPDGYTILGLPSSGLAITLLRKTVPYSIMRDLKPVIGLGSIPLALVVNANSPIKSVADLVSTLKARDLVYGSGGPGTLAHLTTASFLGEVQGKATHVPFRGNPDVMLAIYAGQVDFFFAAVADAVAASGKVRILATTSAERIADQPEIPTMIESGFKEFTPSLWYAIMVPAATPDAVVARLHDAFAAVATDPELISRLKVFGVNVKPLNPAGLSAKIKEEAARWSRVIEQNNLAVTQ